MTDQPAFSCEFVQGAWRCFARRRKAIRGRALALEVGWSDHRFDVEWFEYSATSGDYRLRLVVHDAPAIDVEVIALCNPRAGRKLVRIHGMRVFPNPEPLRDAFERSLSVLWRSRDEIEALENDWNRLRVRVLR